MKRISVCGPCWNRAFDKSGEDECHCNEYDNADPDVVGYPPFHKGCVCVVEETMEVEFRVWDTKEEQMIRVGEMSWLQGGLHISDGFSVSGFVKDRFILMRYIGGEDKKGKRIFQYDIIRERDYFAVIRWGITGWSPFEYCGGSEVDIRDAEKVGNIFEDPELRRLVRRW